MSAERWAQLPGRLDLSWIAGDDVAVPVTLSSGGSPVVLDGELQVQLSPAVDGATLAASVTDEQAGSLALQLTGELPAGYQGTWQLRQTTAAGVHRTLLHGLVSVAGALS